MTLIRLQFAWAFFVCLFVGESDSKLEDIMAHCLNCGLEHEFEFSTDFCCAKCYGEYLWYLMGDQPEAWKKLLTVLKNEFKDHD